MTRLRSILRDLGRELGEISRRRRIAIASHPSADPDSLSSAVAISLVSISSSSKPACYATGGFDTISSTLYREAVLRGYIEPCPSSLEGAGVLVIVDAPSCERASIDCKGYEAIYLVDHHIPQEPLGIYRGVVEPSASSTTELCVLMLEEALVDIPSTWLANLLLSGILYDTRGLSMASIASIEAVRFLMMRGARISDAFQMIRRPPEISERIARVKAMARVKAYRAGDIIVCITHVGAFEASAAQILVGAGCDLALVISERGDSMRVVARCSEDLCRDRGLGEVILSDLARIYGGGWGGHKQAAVASIKSPGGFEEILGGILEILGTKLGERLRPLDSS